MSETRPNQTSELYQTCPICMYIYHVAPEIKEIKCTNCETEFKCSEIIKKGEPITVKPNKIMKHAHDQQGWQPK